MINQYIENTIKRKVSVLESIYATPGITSNELAAELSLAPHLIQRVISDLKLDSSLKLQDQKGHFKIDHIQSIIDYNTTLYRQSSFLNYLYFVLNNTNENISVVNLSFILNRSTSSLYETRKRVQMALNEYGLTLYKNTVQGSELAHRMLIVLLRYKYNLRSDATVTTFAELVKGDDSLDRLLQQHLHISFPNNYKLEFYRLLIAVGLERLNFQNQLSELSSLSIFHQTKLAHQVQQLIDAYVDHRGIQIPLLPVTYDYFIYVTLIAAPLDFDDEIYHRLLQLPPYQQIQRCLLSLSPFKDQLENASIQALMTHIFTQTFLNRDRFIEKAQFDLAETTTITLHPAVIKWVEQTLQADFNRSFSTNLLHEISVKIQSLLFTKFPFHLGILALATNAAFVDGLRQRMRRVIYYNIDILDLPTIEDFSPYLAQYDAVIVLASSQSFVLLREQYDIIDQVNLKLIPVTNQDLLDLPIRIINLAWEMKH